MWVVSTSETKRSACAKERIRMPPEYPRPACERIRGRGAEMRASLLQKSCSTPERLDTAHETYRRDSDIGLFPAGRKAPRSCSQSPGRLQHARFWNHRSAECWQWTELC